MEAEADLVPESLQAEIRDSYRRFLEATGFQRRGTQQRMIGAIARQLLSAVPILAVEAGTGTGKTLAYLLAAVPIARHLEKTLVISTGTVALQEQLVNKDIPDAVEKAGLDFAALLVKGRGRYLCELKLQNGLAAVDDEQLGMYLGEGHSLSGNRLHLYQEMAAAFSAGDWDGDRDSWDAAIPEVDWRPLTSDRYQCTAAACPHVERCAFFRARGALDKAQVLVANHDLVLADLALGGGVILPAVADCIYIFDEAHHLGDKARRHFAQRFRHDGMQDLLEQQGQRLPRLREDLGDIKGLAAAVDEAAAQVAVTAERLHPLRPLLQQIMAEAETEAGFASRELNPSRRFAHGQLPAELAAISEPLRDGFAELFKRVQGLADTLEPEADGDGDSGQRERRDRWFVLVGQWLARIEGARDLWGSYARLPDSPDHARWLRYYEKFDDYELFDSPVLAGGTLRERLWSRAAGAVLTSATLTALGDFERLKLRTGLDAVAAEMETGGEVACLQLPSPFDYANRAALHIPPDAVDPREAEMHDEYLVAALPRLLAAGEGNLVLFASKRQMDTVFDRLDEEWQKRVLVQGSRSKQRLLDLHRARIDEGRGSTLFGLASFAEGIDLPGAYCAHVLIAKIPFAVPTEPAEEALAEWVEGRGGNAFREISLADASMRLVQAAGRLLRSETDSGRVTITDERLRTKRYGAELLAALPPMPVYK